MAKVKAKATERRRRRGSDQSDVPPKERTGMIVVLSGASGSGKTTLATRLMELVPRLEKSISFTTRPPRSNEVPEVSYHLNKAIGVYLHTHLSLGSITNNNVSGYTGNFATAITGEYTLPMRVFLGAGAGYGVLNNPSGPLVGFRVGYYPFETTSAEKKRRLNIALDTRLYFVSAGAESITMKHIAVSIGYDRF